MIDKLQVMDLLLQACPSYKTRWNEYCKSCYSDGEERLFYVDVGDFAHHLVDSYKVNKTFEFHQVFDVIEQLHLYGDDYVKELATIGLLEGMQNVSLNNELDPNVFVPYLKPETKVWWDRLNDFWSGNITYIHDEN